MLRIQQISGELGLEGSGRQLILNAIVESIPPLLLPQPLDRSIKPRKNCLFRVPYWLPDYIDLTRLPKQSRGAWLVKRVVDYFFQPKPEPDWRWNRRIVEVLGNKTVKDSLILNTDEMFPGAEIRVSGNRISLLYRIQSVIRIIGETELRSKSLSATLTWLSIRHALKQENPPQVIRERVLLFTELEKARLDSEVNLLKGRHPSL